MTNLQSKKNYPYNPWNPFTPTLRDIERTEKLANKNRAITGISAYFLPIVTMLYLNRGVNTLKILGYAVLTIFALVIVLPELEDDTYESMGEAVGFAAGIAIVAENVHSINLAKERSDKSQVLDDVDV